MKDYIRLLDESLLLIVLIVVLRDSGTGIKCVSHLVNKVY